MSMTPEIKNQIQESLNLGATRSDCRAVEFIAGWLSNTLTAMEGDSFTWFSIQCVGSSERHINMNVNIRWQDDQPPVLYNFNSTKQIEYGEHGQTVVMKSAI